MYAPPTPLTSGASGTAKGYPNMQDVTRTEVLQFKIAKGLASAWQHQERAKANEART
jgi:hypothetical protein